MSSLISKPRAIAWVVWVIASVFYAYQYILRVMPNIMLDDIMQQFDIGAATFGQFSGSLLHRLLADAPADRHYVRPLWSEKDHDRLHSADGDWDYSLCLCRRIGPIQLSAGF